MFRHAGPRGRCRCGAGDVVVGDVGGGDRRRHQHAGHHAGRHDAAAARRHGGHGHAALHAEPSLLWFVHPQHVPQPRFQHHVCRALAAPVQPVLKVLDFDDMGDLGIPDLHGDGGQPCPDVADPVVTAHHGEGLGDRFVERFRRHVELVRGVVQVMDNDGAGFGRHDGNLSYSLFVRLKASI